MQFTSFRLYLVLTVVLANLNISTMAQAGKVTFCAGIFGSTIASALFSGTVPKLTSEEKKRWEDLFSSEGDFVDIPSLHHPSQLGEENLMVWWMYDKLPAPFQNHLESIDLAGQDARTAIQLMLRNANTNIGSGYLNELFLNYMDYRVWSDSQPVTFAAWIRLGRARYAAALHEDEGLDEALGTIYESEIRKIEMRRFWRAYGEQNIAATQLANRSYEIKIGDELYQGKVTGSHIILDRVPRNRVAVPAWNPMPEMQLYQMLVASVRPPKEFRAVLGLDGNFYLLDGNKRFTISGAKEVRIQLSWPLQTSSLREYLDLVGIRQPLPDKLEEFYLGRLDLKSLIPYLEHTALIFDPTSAAQELAP